MYCLLLNKSKQGQIFKKNDFGVTIMTSRCVDLKISFMFLAILYLNQVTERELQNSESQFWNV